MAYDFSIRVRWLAAWATRQAEQTGKTPVEILETIHDAIARNDIAGGKILISTTEAGGTVSFTVPKGHTPLEIGDLAQQAIDLLNNRRKIKRLRASFRNALP